MSFAKIQELKDKGLSCHAKMKEILDAHFAQDTQVWTDNTKRSEYEKYEKDLDEAIEGSERLNKLMESERLLAGLPAQAPSGKSPSSQTIIKTPEMEFAEFKGNFAKFVREEITRDQFAAASVMPSTQGGALVVPEIVRQEILKGVDDLCVMRQLCPVVQLTGAEGLKQPTMESDVSDIEFTSEISTGTEGDAPTWGFRELAPKEMAKLIKYTRKLARLRKDIDSFLIGRLQYKMARTQENAFLNGNGANAPLGLFVASNYGIPTSCDVSGSNTTTAISADTLIDIVFALKSGYNPRWLMHRLVLKAIRKLKDQQNQYLWQPGLQNGNPGTILDYPYTLSELAPSTFTASSYVAIFGDFRFYEIVEGLQFELQVLDQTYATENKIGLVARAAIDGAPMLPEAFVRMQMAAS